MPELDWNKKVWDTASDWSGRGEEWSGAWGTAANQWYWSLLPRIHPFVPCGTMLEIAPGAGRWTHWLKDLCKKLILIDYSQKCIDLCKDRFHTETHIEYIVNDGRTLPGVPDRSIDFAFSFDSLVHVELDVLEGYLKELARVLTKDGVAFLHHSNLGHYAALIRRYDRLPRGKHRLERWGVIEVNPNNRALSVTAEAVAGIAKRCGLSCFGQELFNWGDSRRLSECNSVLALQGSKWARETVVDRNPHFMADAARTARIANCLNRQDVTQPRESDS
jgi:SAM-dependent methyltransferase